MCNINISLNLYTKIKMSNVSQISVEESSPLRLASPRVTLCASSTNRKNKLEDSRGERNEARRITWAGTYSKCIYILQHTFGYS